MQKKTLKDIDVDHKLLTWRACLPEVWNCACICLATVASSFELTDFSSWFNALSPTPFYRIHDITSVKHIQGKQKLAL